MAKYSWTQRQSDVGTKVNTPRLCPEEPLSFESTLLVMHLWFASHFCGYMIIRRIPASTKAEIERSTL